MNDITICIATLDEVFVINRLAHEIWWPAYAKLLPHDQIDFMLKAIYSFDALRNQMAAGQRFCLAKRNGDAIGFVGFQPKPSVRSIMRIEKLYVLPSEQKKGIGKLLIDYVAQIALTADLHCLELNVYQYNPAKAFYEREGFKVVEAVEIPYHGYVLNDYVMQKQLP
ncbi:GNAT family N-acetyltransferase [Parapedobacter deserti]|uniref:GNAT family N-acetyltransferase n=1 Tax=Parapedobacter deserti TaxID=1912957 RepID=A0ABV7JV62_9SPHI